MVKPMLAILVSLVVCLSPHPNCFAQKLTATLQGHRSNVNSVTYSPDGKTLASASDDGTIKLWDMSTGKLKTSLQHFSFARSAVFTPDGKTLVSGGWNNCIKIWDVTSGKLKNTTSFQSLVNQVVMSPDGKTVACAIQNPFVKICDANSGEVKATIKEGSTAVFYEAMSPDGKTVASSGRDGPLKLWNPKNQKQRAVFEGISGPMDFSPDGNKLAAIGKDNTILLLSIGKTIPLKGHTDRVSCVAFSPDSKILASASQKTIKLWDISTGKAKATFESTTSVIVNALTFRHDGKMLVVGGNKDIELWDISSVK